MKRVLLSAGALLLMMWAHAQQKQGTVTYERVAQMRMNLSMNGGAAPNIPQSRTDKFELRFGNNQSLWKQAEKENDDNENTNSDGMMIRTIVAGTDDVLYSNFNAAKTSELRVFFDKKFIVDDSIRSLRWKIGEDTKNIIGHQCRKATATAINPRMTMTIDNGKMERREVQDTSMITAWFAADIPVSAGPGEYQGQLPGLILALDVNNGRQVYKATEIKEQADLASIKEPTGKKHVTPAEFRKEREKMMEEMQQNTRGGNTRIRMN